MMKPRSLGYVALGLVAAAGMLRFGVLPLALNNPAVQDWIVRRSVNAAADRGAARLAMVEAPELRAVLCGTASPMPNRERAGTCTAVMAAGQIWIVDVGGGSVRNMLLWQLPQKDVRGILLTHFHSDHIEDLGEANLQSWVGGRPAQLPVYGGPGIDDVVNGFNQAYSLDRGYRTAHHGVAMLPPDHGSMQPHVIATADGKPLAEGASQTVLEQDGLKITAIGVNHAPVSPAYAYMFSYKGRSLVVSGDTRSSPAFAAASAGVDVMIHEVQAAVPLAAMGEALSARGNDRIAKIVHDIRTYHATPEEAAAIANTAGAKLLVMTHLTPPVPKNLCNDFFLNPTKAIRPSGSVVGEDGTLISLPPDSSAVEVGLLD